MIKKIIIVPDIFGTIIRTIRYRVMNKNVELYTLIDKVMQYIPENLLEDDNKTTTLSKIQLISDRLKTGVYDVQLDLNKVFYRLNNRFEP